MVKLLFKLFALATVVGFYTAAGLFMAITAVVPVNKVPVKIYTLVYPLATENTQIRLGRIFKNISTGTINQKITFSELEANAFIYKFIGANPNFPIKEPYAYFLKDTVRLRFDVSTGDAWKFITNQLKGADVDENLKQIAAANNPSSRISFTVDIGVEWVKDHPEMKVENAYIGVLPVPFLSFFNNLIAGLNKKLASGFTGISDRGNLYVKNFRMNDKYLTFDIEAKVTDQFVQNTERSKIMKDNPEFFDSLNDPVHSSCKYGCTPEQEDQISRVVQQFAVKNTLSEDDFRLAKKTLADIKNKK